MRHANCPPASHRAARFSDGAFLAAAVAATALIALVAIGARTWIDRPFAGFFLRADRTIAAVGRVGWSDVAPGRLYDRTLLAIDGATVTDSDAVHRIVAAKPVGSTFTYTVTDGHSTENVAIPSRRFATGDYWAVFGAYLGSGLCFVLLAIVAAWMLPADRLGRSLVFLGSIGGLYMLSSADLYPPAASLRANALATTLLPPTLLQFALAAGDARGRFARWSLPVAWTLAVAAAVSMKILLGDPAATGWISATCNAALGLALAAAAIGLAARVRVTADAAPLVAFTAIFGLGVPGVIFLVSGTLGGMPQNASATLAFLFPLGMMAALYRSRLGLDAVRADVARSARSL
jgi:hypothetical protein